MSASPSDRPAAGRKCPTCGAPATVAHHPFCSRRCADADLNRWLTGLYAIPARPDDESDQDAPPPVT
jgi:endogenous inhibitor of DNA gyrase (YacG/DUF329 family)